MERAFFIYLCQTDRDMILVDLDTSKMIFDPKDSDVYSQVIAKIPHMKKSISPMKNMEVFRYILLMYDPSSPIVSDVDDYWARKFECVEASGFKISKEGRLEMTTEKMVKGKNDKVIDLIISFLGFVNKHEWTQFIFYHETLLNYTTEALGGSKANTKDMTIVASIRREMGKIAKEMLINGDETDSFMKRMYYRAEADRLQIRPEDYAKKLAKGDNLNEDNPYGDDYVVDKIRFEGDKIPKDGRKKEEGTQV